MNNSIKRIATGLILGLCFWASLMFAPPILFSCLLAFILTTIIVVEWRNLFNIYTPMFWLIMPLYPILPFALLMYLNHNPHYHTLLLFLFVIVSSYDTGGYVVGSLIGTHKMAPRISPRKSWEGFWGGYICACLSLTFLLYELGKLKPWWIIASFTAVVCIFSCVGDLFESWLKRNANIKDSGTSLPGHGGFLDRFDGILCAVFFFYFFRDILVAVFDL